MREKIRNRSNSAGGQCPLRPITKVPNNNYNKCLTVKSLVVKMPDCLRTVCAVWPRVKIKPARKGVDYGR